jgi:hypothetical protein
MGGVRGGVADRSVVGCVKKRGSRCNLGGTIWFGLDKDGKYHVATDGDSYSDEMVKTYGYLGWNASEDAPLLDKAETFAEEV